MREIDALCLPEMIFRNSDNQIQRLMHGGKFTLNTEESEILSCERMWRDKFYSDVHPDASLDIRSVWEPARLQNISVLLADITGSDDRSRVAMAKNIAKNEVLEWLDSNPFFFGPHYMSAMECGLRIPVFFYCLKGLDNLTDADSLRLLTFIYEHAWLVFKRLSLYSSVGNHTVAECVGLVFGGAMFRNSREGMQWLQKGSELLEQELYHQVLADGGPAEQSLSYHRFVLDLYWLAADFLESNNLADCSSWKTRLIEGEHFLACFSDLSGNLPSIGDSDDGRAMAPGICPKRDGKDTVETKPCITFPESGYTVVRGDNGMLLTFDHGQLGMGPLYNHGHADALSITLSVAGEQVIVDPGTFRYNGVPEWRRYFKGTRAHNTVTIDARDQAIQATGFIWSHPYSAKLVKVSDNDGKPYIEATHDGYSRLPEPVIHRRVVAFCSRSLFLIKDSFSGKGLHNFELNFHVHPDCTFEWNGRHSLIKKGAAEISIMLLGGKEFSTSCGDTAPPFGWYSQAYGLKTQSPVLFCEMHGQPDHVSYATAISLGGTIPDKAVLEEIACRL